MVYTSAPMSSTPSARPFNNLKISVPPFCLVLFEELSFPTPCYFTNCPNTPPLSPIKSPLFSTERTTEASVEVSMELTELNKELSELKKEVSEVGMDEEEPLMFASDMSNLSMFDQIDRFPSFDTVKFSMDTEFLDDEEIDSDNLFPQVDLSNLSMFDQIDRFPPFETIKSSMDTEFLEDEKIDSDNLLPQVDLSNPSMFDQIDRFPPFDTIQSSMDTEFLVNKEIESDNLLPQVDLSNLSMFNQIDRFPPFDTVKSSMDTDLLDDEEVASDNLLPQVDDLYVTEIPIIMSYGNSKSPPRPHCPRRARSYRTLSAEQKNSLVDLLSGGRVRFLSGSDRNVIAKQIRVPASQMFRVMGRKMTN